MSYTPVLEPFLRLPAHLQWVEDHLRGTDGALRLRRSNEVAGFFVLERKVSFGPPIHTKRPHSDAWIACRDGYLFLSHVHPALVANPLELVMRLRADGGDMHAAGNGAKQTYDRIVSEKADADAKWEKDVEDTFEHYYREGHDTLQRMGDAHGIGRFRINNAGLPSNDVALIVDEPITHGDDAGQPSRTGDPAVHGGNHEQGTEAPAG